MNCLFCRINLKQLPHEIVLESEHFLVVNDVAPLASKHLIAFSKRHFVNMGEITESEVLDLVSVRQKLSEIFENGCRMIINDGPAAFQEIGHFHVHLLAGQALQVRIN